MISIPGNPRTRVEKNRKPYPLSFLSFSKGKSGWKAYCSFQLILLLFATPADAAAPDSLDRYLREGRIDDGIAAYALATNNAGRFSLAVLQALNGLQGFSASLNKLGLHPEFIRSGLPFLRAVAPNRQSIPKEPATPEKVASAFKNFRASLRQANSTLVQMSADEFGVEINLSQARLDLDGDGIAQEPLAHSLGRVLGIDGQPQPGEDKEVVVRFDSADAIWLEAYTHFLSGMLDLLLAYDWRPVWDQCAHLVFVHPEPAPRIAPFSGELRGFARWVDLIAAVHDMRLELVDKEGPRNARDQFRAMIAGSRVCWQRILAESDNDREWLPSPKQNGPAGIRITQAQVDGWQRVLDELEAIATGQKLLPHWRIKSGMGINIEKLIVTPPRLDLVLLIQGSSLLPYLQDGPVSNRETWRNLMQPFGPGFARFAIWSN